MIESQIQGIKREIDSSDRDYSHCYHCGSDFEEVIVEAHTHQFCCEGCKTVYEILEESGLHNYYGIENNPGNKVWKDIENKYAFLESPEVIEGLLEFNDGGVSSVKFYVPKIHCSSCIWLLENMHRLQNGIVNSTVNFLKKEVYIVFNSEIISLRRVVDLMASIGYEPNISLNDYKKEVNKIENKSFFYKLGIAGFAFGNIMLLSFPEYFDTNDYLEVSFKKLFGYLNLFLATPVLLYSASDYFVSAYKALTNRYLNIDFPVSIGILALYTRSAFEIISNTGAGFMDSFTMFVFLLLVGKWYQNRTYQALSFERDYTSYFPLAVVKVFVDKEEPVPVGTLEIGDVVILRNQEIVPTDSELLSDFAQIDYSFVTGESVPIHKVKGDKVFAGGRQLGVSIKLKVQKPVSQSYLTRLWNQDTFAKEGSQFQSVVDKVSKFFTLFVLIISTSTFLFWWPEGHSLAFKIFTSVLIIACPCALALTLPFTFGNTMSVFGRNRFYLKNSDSVEKMAQVDTLVFDKTGTLTQSGNEKVVFVGDVLTPVQKSQVYSLVFNSTHPLSKTIYQYLSGSATLDVTGYKEVPAMGVEAIINNEEVKIGSASYTQFNGLETTDLSSRVYIRLGANVKGYFLIKKQYRNGISDLMASVKKIGYHIHLISGDNSSELENLSKYFDLSNLHFNQSPQNKLDYVKKLQSKGHRVLMVGDGLNDAGALKQADVGLAVSDDVYNFTPACDAILDADNFTQLGDFLSFSKRAIKVVKISFGISLFYNTLGMVFAIQGFVTPLFAAVLMPVSSITVVSFITISIRWVAKQKSL
ncbi:MAG: Cu+-exporting ATPase [Halieaceae bacterium]|jgi:Cu+-exporting ATPase